jgi:hypothetical protein
MSGGSTANIEVRSLVSARRDEVSGCVFGASPRLHYRCTICGSRDDLTVHFKPGGWHTTLLSDYATLCSSCNGSVDAPRAAL